MFGRRITLFKLFGFAVRLDASWLVIAALVSWTLAAGVFPGEYPGLSAGTYWWMGITGALLLFASIIVHELFHSLVARHYGLPMKGITLFIFGGVAEMGDEPPSPKAEFLMAIAGPMASILIGFLFYWVYLAGKGTWAASVAGVIGYLYWINWLLAAFNLIPAFPLDGGRLLRSALWHWKGDLPRATRIASSVGSAFGVGLIVLAIFQLLRGNFISAVWWFLIGMFLRGAARGSYRQVLVRDALAGEPVRRFMKRDPVTVPPTISIRELVDDYVYKYHYKMFPVVGDSQKLAGCVTTQQLKRIPDQEWNWRTVQDVLQPCSADTTVSPEADALDALVTMSRSGNSRLMVVENGRLVAVIALKDLLSFLSVKFDLESHASGPFESGRPT
jgi:Zn-dependent protease